MFKPKEFRFSEIKRLEAYAKKRSGKGGSFSFKDIYLRDHSIKKIFLARLPNGPLYYVNDKVFMQALEGLIRAKE